MSDIDKKKLIDDCYKIQEFTNEFILKLNDNALIILKNFIVNEFKKVLYNNNFEEHDKKMFEYYSDIKSNYKKIFNFYDDIGNKIIDEEKQDIFYEIKEILLIQNEQFSELNNVSNITTLYEEKENVIKKHIDDFIIFYYENLSKFKEGIAIDFESEEYLNLYNSENSSIVIYDFVLNNFIENLVLDVYDLYIDIKYNCFESINDLENNKPTEEYFDILKQEFEILSDIVRVKLISTKNEESVTKEHIEQHDAIKEFFELISETYNFMNINFEKSKEFLLDNEEIDNIDYVAFVNSFAKYYKNEFTQENEEIKFFIDIFIKKFLSIRDSLFLQIKKNIVLVTKEDSEDYKEKLNVNYEKNIKITDELVNTLRILINYYDNNIEKLEKSKDKDILNGINETIVIKIDVMEENLKDYKNNKDTRLKKIFLDEGNIILSSRSEELIIKDFLRNWNDDKEEFVNELDLFLNDNNNIINNIEKNLKDIENEKDKIEKYIFRFKKEYLFFEIITLEEISNYSVSKLRENNGNTEQDYITIFDKVLYEINEVLEKYGIKRIVPEESQEFDLKEHEILLAETREDFKKGEIIKVVNNGFKDENAVIIRANIIVAK